MQNMLVRVFFILSTSIFLCLNLAAQQTNINGPAGSERFGTQVVALPNGNIVVTDPNYDAPGPIADVGAVYLYNGSNGALISTLTGSTANDFVGLGGITVLTNGNFVIRSPLWSVLDFGAVTFGNGTTGINGVVSSSNSLVGSTAGDSVGNFAITVLSNGNYVVRIPNWNDTVGAVTFGNGTMGINGVVSASNSLVGSEEDDRVGEGGVTALTNGNYVVSSPVWDNRMLGQQNVGAVTWGNGTTGTTGVVSSANSLVGSTLGDEVGNGGATALTNGNYVVRSRVWNGTAQDVGAVTWGNGTTGTTGVVSSANSLVGSTAGDNIGEVTALTNGNYVVSSPRWDSTAQDVGAVTWCNGTTGTTGVVSSANSLVGSTANDNVGNFGVTALTNGNYVVASIFWDNGGIVNAGAVTWGNGTSGTTGVVTSSNSLVGSTLDDRVGGVTALMNGNYVVSSPLWDNGGIVNVGAVTWANGTSGISGVVSASTSLVGSTANDQVGGVTALANGNYVVRSQNWDGTAQDVGAVTWCNGTTGTTGVVSSANSLVGSTLNDFVGNGGVTALPSGNYVVSSTNWDNGGIVDAGAISYLSGNTGMFSENTKSSEESAKQTPPTDDLTIAMSNSVLGTTANRGNTMNFSFDPTNNQLVVGRPLDNIVTLFKRLGVTAANVSVRGRVLNAKGTAIPNAIVSMTDGSGQIRTVRSNGFGYYKFENVQAGETYIFDAKAKGYSFASQVRSIDDNLKDFDMIAQ